MSQHSTKPIKEILMSPKCSLRELVSVWQAKNIGVHTCIKVLKNYYTKAYDAEHYSFAYAALFGLCTTYITRLHEVKAAINEDVLHKLLGTVAEVDFNQRVHVVDKMLALISQNEFHSTASYFRRLLDKLFLESQIENILHSDWDAVGQISMLAILKDQIKILNPEPVIIDKIENRIRMLDYGYAPSLMLQEATMLLEHTTYNSDIGSSNSQYKKILHNALKVLAYQLRYILEAPEWDTSVLLSIRDELNNIRQELYEEQASKRGKYPPGEQKSKQEYSGEVGHSIVDPHLSYHAEQERILWESYNAPAALSPLLPLDGLSLLPEVLDVGSDSWVSGRNQEKDYSNNSFSDTISIEDNNQDLLDSEKLILGDLTDFLDQ